MGAPNLNHYTQFLFQEEASVSQDIKNEESTAFDSSAPDGVWLKRRRWSKRSPTRGQFKTSTQRFSIKEESLWKTYNANMRVHLDMWLAKAVRRDGTNDGVVAIRTFTKTSRDQVLQRYATLDHRGLVTAFEIFLTDDTNKHIHVVSEYLPFCLDHVVASSRCPTNGQLASIMAQVIPIAHLFTSILLITDNSRFSMHSLICI